MLKQEKRRYLVDEKMAERVHDFKMALQGHDPDQIIPDQKFNFLKWFDDYVLSVEPDPYNEGATRLLLSYGEPSDYFSFFPDGKIVYYYSTVSLSLSCEPRGRDFLVLWYVQDLLEHEGAWQK